MPAQWTTNPQRTLPPAAANVAVTPSGSAWTWGAWQEITAALAPASALTGITLRRVYDSTVVEHEIEIGVGAPASEVAIARFKGLSWWFGNPNENGMHLPLKLPRTLPAGSRLSVRIRLSSTDVTVWRAALTYLELPIVGNLLTTTSAQLAYPDGSAMVSIAAVGSWAASGWSTLLASVPADFVLTALAIAGGGGSGHGPEADIELGIGTAASEVPIDSLRIQCDQPCLPYVPFSNPLDAIPSGSRIAARVWSGDTRSFSIAIHGLPKPL